MNEQIASAAELDALTDLVVRLNRANKGLLSQSRTNITSERTRLEGKAEGVRLALSYVEEAIRARPDQPQRVQPSREDVVLTLFELTKNPHASFGGQADAVLALFAQQPTVAEVKAEAWDEGHRHAWRRGPDECMCSAWSSNECACGLYGSGELLSLADNPYREARS